jgi:hypothetical protein
MELRCGGRHITRVSNSLLNIRRMIFVSSCFPGMSPGQLNPSPATNGLTLSLESTLIGLLPIRF